MFMFGFLKFFHPFKGWYTVQITASNLGRISYVMGIAGELLVGIIFLGTIILHNKFVIANKALLSILASAMVMVMMITGTYVHLHPSVPAEVLPMDIKPPFIPLFFFATALFNIVILLWLKKNSPRRVTV